METFFTHRKISFLSIFFLLFQILAPWSNIVFAIGTSFQKTLVQANVPAVSEVRATSTLMVNAIPADGETITIGTSTITFMDIPGVDDNQLNTSGGTGYIDITYEPGDILRTTHEIAAMLRSLTYVFDVGHGALVVGGESNMAIFTTDGAESSPTPISFTDGTSGKITVSSGTVGALPVAPVAQVVDLRPILPEDHLLYRASIGSNTAAYATTSSSTEKDIVEVIQPALDAHPDVSCTENDVKITCTADVPGIEFVYNAELVNLTSLYNAINAEYADGASRTTYKLIEANYAPTSWTAYIQSLTDAILLENNGGVTDVMITDAVALIDTKKGELTMSFPHSYDITSNSSTDSNIDATSYNGKVFVTYERGGNTYFKEGIGSEELVGVGTSPAIAVSSNGTIGILYTNGGLKFKKKSTGIWGNEVNIVGSILSYDIDMDSSGKAHVVYDDGGTGGRGHVVYVVENGVGTWTAPIIDLYGIYDGSFRVGTYYHNPLIKIDHNNKYHIVYELDSWDTQASWSSRGIVITSDAVGGSASLGGIGWNMGLTWSRNALTTDGNNVAHFLYSYAGTIYHGTVSGDAWESTSLGLGIINPFISSDGTSVGIAYNNGLNEVRYMQDDGSGFVGSTLITSTASNPAVTMSNGEVYIYYVKNDGTDDEVKLESTTSIYTVPGQIDNPDDSFILGNGSSALSLSNLQVGGVYSIMSGSTIVSSGVLVATSTTGSIPLIPSMSMYTKMNFTLSGSYNGTMTTNISTKSLYVGFIDIVDFYHNTVAPGAALGGIMNNFSGVTYSNIQDFIGLYFEKPGLGKIVFASGMDLTNFSTQVFLQDLPDYLSMNDGFVSLSGSALKDYSANISMYFNTGSTFVSGINTPDNFVIKSSTGTILNAGDVLSNIHGACGVGEPYCTIFFDTAHFTSFDLKPFLTNVSIRSNNPYSSEYVKNGDRLILDFTGSESLPALSVAINGTGASSVVDLGSNNYRATSVPLDGGTGIATFSISFMDANGNNGDSVSVTTDASSVTLDTVVPIITENTPIVSLTDDNTPNLVISASELSTPSFTGSCSAGTGTSTIGGGINTITFYALADGIHSDCYVTLIDLAGNQSIPLHITSFVVDTTAPIINYEQVKDIKDTNVNLDVSFSDPNMGVSPYGIVSYTDGGTSSGTANFYFTGNIASTSLTGLNPDTAYTYTVTLRDSLGNTRNSTGHFSSAFYISGLEGDLSETGAIAFGLDGDLLQGETYNLGGNLYLYSDQNDDNSITGSLVFSGVNIMASSGDWDGVLIPPTLMDPESDEAATGSEIGDGVNIVQTIKAGSETAGLGAIGGYFTVSFAVPGYGSGTIFSIYRSEDGNSWVLNTPDSTCVLDATMMCTFRTDHLSFFAPAIDIIPDAFNFAPSTNSELSTANTSNTVTVSGIATGTTISIVGGSYQIGSGAFTTLVGIVQNGETVKVRATSSSNYSTTINSVLTIGGVSATYSVTTKAAPSSGNTGGGGGGVSMDYCPNGDTSGSLYDNKCISQNNGNSGNIGGIGSSNMKSSFKDIANSFARVYIESLYASGVVSGYPNGTFHPNMPITRADWIVWVMKAYKIPLITNTGTVFTDIPKNSTEIVPYLNTAKEMGIISGQVKNGKLLFRPNASITRAEALKILFLVAKENTISQKKLIFVDDDFSSWMISYVIRANELDIINGQTINRKLYFRPNMSITRGEAAKILAQFLKIQKK